MTGMQAATRSPRASGLSTLAQGALATLVVGLLGWTGCVPPSENNASTTPSQQQGATGGQVCHEERPLGSNISRTVCRPQEDVDRDRREAQKYMDAPRPVPSTRD